MENINKRERILMTDKLFENLGFKKLNGFFEGSSGYKYEKTRKIGRGRNGINERISVKKVGEYQYLIRHEFLGDISIDGIKSLYSEFGAGSGGNHKTISYFDDLCDYLHSRQSVIVKEEDFFIC